MKISSHAKAFRAQDIAEDILALEGACSGSLGATVFATGWMRFVNDAHGDLIDGAGRADLAIARANIAFTPADA